MFLLLDAQSNPLDAPPFEFIEDALLAARSLGQRVTVVKEEGVAWVPMAHCGPGGWKGPGTQRKVEKSNG